MTAVEEVNERVTNLATTQRQDSHELYVRDEDVQDGQALLRAQISLLMRKRRYFYSMASSYEREAVYAQQAWSRSKDMSTAIEAFIRAQEACITTLEAQTRALFRELVRTKDVGHQDRPADASSNYDQMIHTFADRQAENKRKLDDNSMNNQTQQQPYKRPYKKDYPKLKNKNCGNQAKNGEARASAYAVGNAGTYPYSNVIMGTSLLNNRYAPILFDTSADRSFVSTAFSSLIDIVPTTLDIIMNAN
ncbi:hypothetical protein Tco_0918939 [Tanacetum coccineum]